MESAEEVFRGGQLFKVLILEASHLLLNLLRFLKFATFEGVSTFRQHDHHLIVVES